jgi:hypothetical protein
MFIIISTFLIITLYKATRITDKQHKLKTISLIVVGKNLLTNNIMNIKKPKYFINMLI